MSKSMSNSPLFYLFQWLAVFALGMMILTLLLETGPVFMTISIMLLAVLIGIISPINSKKHARDIDELAIQRVDRKYVLSNKRSITSAAFVISLGFAVILLSLNIFLPLSIENKVLFAAAVVVNGCAAPFAYRTAAVAIVKYAKSLK